MFEKAVKEIADQPLPLVNGIEDQLVDFSEAMRNFFEVGNSSLDYVYRDKTKFNFSQNPLCRNCQSITSVRGYFFELMHYIVVYYYLQLQYFFELLI
uniref:Uncharacterized protein n=1 Tax=Lactuca sativa TaxID=4236 RepID=A0A9R1X5K4_LACSA|nr:hypothetical protein LSAT_V11C600312770 [Lactuca sativa]